MSSGDSMSAWAASRPPAALLHAGDDLFRQVLVDLVVDDDRAALVGQRERQFAADAARAPGDQRDLAVGEAAAVPRLSCHQPTSRSAIEAWTGAKTSRAMIVFWISLVPSSKRCARASR